MINDIKQLVDGCLDCTRLLPSQIANPSVTKFPSAHLGVPMQHVRIDLFSHLGSTYLVCVDHWSGYPLYDKLSSVSTASVIKCLKQWLNPLGWPKSIKSDGGHQFTKSFDIFCAANNIIHELAAPYNP